MGAFAGPNISENSLVLALDAANKKSYSQNEFQYSTDIFGWSGTSAYAATLSRDTISSPVGNTPLKMVVTGNDPHLGTYNSGPWNIAPAANGQTWVVSVYVKANVATTGEILIFGANSAGTGFVGGAWLAISAVGFNVTTEWARVSYYITMANADIAFIHTRLDGPHTGGTGQTVWWDGLQVERVPAGTTTPTPFTSSYYGGSVYRDLVGSNNGTLVNGPTYNSANGGSIAFTRTLPPTAEDGGYATLNTSGILTAANYLHNNHTTEVWFKSNDRNPTNYNGTETVSALVVYTGYHSMWYYNTSSYIYNIWGQTSGVNNTYGLSIADSAVNVWTQLVAVRSGTTLTLYKNGVSQTSGTITSGTDGIPNNNTIRIAVANYGGDYSWHSNINFGSLKMYKRALTAQEVQQNFNATRSRYGI